MFNVLIIGAGKIAAEFDSPDDKNVLTHAHAYKKHADFNLLGFYDVNIEKAKLAAKKWSCGCFENINDMKNIDVASICTPDNCHLDSLKRAAGLNPRLIFLEKPITSDPGEVSEIMTIAKDVPIAVNYSRRYLKEFRDLAARISSGEFENFFTGVGYYGKGFLHNGSHMTDLLRMLIGEIESVEKISEVLDFYDNDPSINANVFFQNGSKFSLQAVNCDNFTIFELDLLFKTARIRILDSGFKIEIYKVADDEIFAGHRKLHRTEEYSTKPKDAMFNAVANISNFLNDKEKLLCDLADGCEAIKYADV
jgi:predicted dehydrogenase